MKKEKSLVMVLLILPLAITMLVSVLFIKVVQGQEKGGENSEFLGTWEGTWESWSFPRLGKRWARLEVKEVDAISALVVYEDAPSRDFGGGGTEGGKRSPQKARFETLGEVKFLIFELHISGRDQTFSFCRKGDSVLEGNTIGNFKVEMKKVQ